MDDLILFRGAPGSGKTTAAKRMFPDFVLIEADDYFMVGGKYLFDHGALQDAHKWCLWRVKQCLDAGDKCVVANTFTRYWEVAPYLRLRPHVPIYRCNGTWGNIHGIPDDVVNKMRDRMEDFLFETNV